MTNFNTQFKLVVNAINNYNDILLNPDSMCWGKMTKEDADDAFNDETCDLHDDWGTKSFNMLWLIKDLHELSDSDFVKDTTVEE